MESGTRKSCFAKELAVKEEKEGNVTIFEIAVGHQRRLIRILQGM
jgi:hypothetical protein